MQTLIIQSSLIFVFLVSFYTVIIKIVKRRKSDSNEVHTDITLEELVRFPTSSEALDRAKERFAKGLEALDREKVYNDAIVSGGREKVYNDAKVYNVAKVYNDAKVSDDIYDEHR